MNRHSASQPGPPSTQPKPPTGAGTVVAGPGRVPSHAGRGQSCDMPVVYQGADGFSSTFTAYEVPTEERVCACPGCELRLSLAIALTGRCADCNDHCRRKPSQA